MKTRSFLSLLIFLALLLSDAHGQVEGGSEFQKKSQAKGSEVSRLIKVSQELREKWDSSAITIAVKAVDVANNAGNEAEKGQALVNAGQTYSHWDEYDKALDYFAKAEPFIKKSGIKTDLAELELEKGIAMRNTADYDAAENSFKESIKLYKESGDSVGENNAVYELADNSRYKGDYDDALELWYQSLRFYENNKDTAGMVDAKEGIGIVFYLRNNNAEARKIFEENLAYYESKKDTVQLGFSYTLMALIYYRDSLWDKSIEFGEKSLSIRKALGDVRGEGESLNNLALAYMGKKQWKSALNYLGQARQALTAGNDIRQIPTILNNIGDSYRWLGKTDSAIYYYDEAAAEALDHGQDHTLALTYRDLSDIHTELGEPKKALSYFRQYAEMKDKIFDEEKLGMMEALEMRYESGKKDQQIAMLERENQVQKRENTVQRQINEMEETKKLWLIIGLIFLALVSLLVFRLMWTRNRNARLAHAREKQLLETREELTAAELKNTRAQLEINQQKLDFYTQNLIQKNEFIEQLQGKLEDGSETTSSDQEKWAKIQELQEMKILTDQDWEEYKTLFDTVYIGFAVKLKQEMPDLTLSEQRLFMLLKLNLNTKEIASMLGVSPDSVKKSRYRLRKKLQLAEDDNLQEFVSSFA